MIKCQKEDSQALDNDASSVRKTELLEASYEINGATIIIWKPTLYITATRALSGKDCSKNSKTSLQINNVAVPRIVNERLTVYEKSDANFAASTFYILKN